MPVPVLSVVDKPEYAWGHTFTFVAMIVLPPLGILNRNYPKLPFMTIFVAKFMPRKIVSFRDREAGFRDSCFSFAIAVCSRYFDAQADS